LLGEVDGFYAAFLEVVARGRSLSVEEVDRLARGRVWSGTAALQHRLVDVFGGRDRAIEEAIALSPSLQHLPRERIRLRALPSSPARPLSEPASSASHAALELLELLDTKLDAAPAPLYYALVPRVTGLGA
jgi:protease-4